MYSKKNIDIINKEVDLNGNTNLISESGLVSQIFSIGDSHTIFYYNSLFIKEHWFIADKLPLTIYKFIKTDIDLYNIGTILGNKHEKYNIKEGDYVLFYFGFNDIQRNVHLHSSDKWEQEIINLATNFIKKVIDLSNKYKIKPIIPCCYPNPLPEAKGQNPSGSYEVRRKYTIFYNQILKNICDNNGLVFFDIYDMITDSNGFIKREFTTDYIHLDYNNYNLKELIETQILKLINPNIKYWN